MQSIDILSFVTFFILMLVGAYLHYIKLCKQGRHFGGLVDYLVADYPGRTVSVGIALLTASWAACTAGVADAINPELVWTMLMAGKIHIPSVTIAVGAVVAGAGFDSQLNKGGAE